jgi:hypothetical protein
MTNCVKRIKRILALSLLLSGAPVIFIVLSLPSWWLYDELAVRKEFGTERPADVKVEKITKPYTVTFSNGKVAEVGPMPASVSNLFHFATGIPAVVLYLFFIKRHGPEWYRAGKWRQPGVSIIEV